MTEQQKPGKIFEAMAAIMRDIKAVGKNGRNESVGRGYNFRSIDDVTNEIHGHLAKHGVFFTPEVVAQERGTGQTKKGDPVYTANLTVKYTFYAAEDGSFVTVQTVGEAADTQDKASNKAMSAALKYALVQLFCIPTSDMAEGDNDSPMDGITNPAPVKKAVTLEYLNNLKAQIQAQCKTPADALNKLVEFNFTIGDEAKALVNSFFEAEKVQA